MSLAQSLREVSREISACLIPLGRGNLLQASTTKSRSFATSKDEVAPEALML